jgi:hypothetical protein
MRPYANGGFFDSHRTLVLSAVLSLAGIATGTAAAFAVLQSFSILELSLLATGVLLAFGVAAWHSRHLPLAALTALAPVPGLLWAAPLARGASYGAMPFLAYGFGFAVAALAVEAGLQRLLGGQGEAPRTAAAFASLLMAVLSGLWFLGSDAALQAAADTILAAASALLLLPFLLLLHFDETFVARANRARERQLRLLQRLSLAMVPRWGLSFTGIVLVFLTLGWFGAAPALPHGLGPLLLRGLTGVLLATAAGTAAGGWREGLAIALITVTACLVLQAAVPAGTDGTLLLTAGALVLLLALQGGRCALAYRQRGDPPPLARQRSLEGAAGAFFAAAGALAALLPALVLWPGLGVFALGSVLAACGIVFVPAVVTALEAVVARRRTAAELFRQHPL